MKSKFVKIHYLKVCSVITAACLLLTATGSSFSAYGAYQTDSPYNDIFDGMNVIRQEYGKVTSVSDNSSDITVVNIQDLHCHEQTQRNISEIIKTLDKNYSLKSVFIEGGYGQIDVSWINKIQDEKTKSAVIEKMLQDGYLTGAEYYAIKNSRYDLLKGIEEKNIHQTNLNRLSKIIEKQPEYNSVISKINKEIEVLSGIYLNERNKRFTRKINEYASGKTDTLKFYRLLHKYVEKIRQSPGQYNNITAINMQDYPNISKYLNISSMSKDINPRQVGIELQALVNVVKNKIPYGSYKRLLSVTNNFNDTGKLAEFLIKFCEQNKIDLSKDFKELDKFFEVSRLNQRINPLELVNEEKILIDQIRMALSYDDTEYEISYINDFAKYFNDYFKYALTSADWKYVRQNFDKFRTLYAKYAAVDRIKDISSDIDFINQYYDTNDYRNNIFTANILNGEKPLQTSASLRTSEQLLKQSKEVIVVITGGYHSQDLESIFSEKKVNDIVITPNVTGDIKNANMRYDGIIKEQASMQSSALAFRLASCLPDEEQKNLMARVAVEIYGKENMGQIRQVAGNDFDISKIETAEFDEQKKSAVKDLMQATVSALVSSLPLNAGKDIFNPDIDDILTKMSLKFYDMGFYFENGPVYEIDSSEYKDKDLLGIPAEIYSRMFDGLQRALLNVQKNRDLKNKLSIFDVLKNKNSIFAFLAKTAPVWEEIIFRAIPSFVIIFNPVAGIALFGVSQIIFLFSHTIVKWLVYRDSSGNRLDFIGILKRDFKNLSIPALTVALPYILTAGAPIFILPVITVASMAIHYFYNKNNPGNPMLILALLKNAAPENVKERMIMYANMMQAGKETINKIKFLDNDLLYSVMSQSSDPQKTAVNLINKIKYVDPAIINAMEEPEYVFDVFEASDALLEYLKRIGFDAYNFNLFFKLRNSAGIKNEEFPNIWLANIVRDDPRMQYLDNAVLTGIQRILRIFGPEMNIDAIQYLFNKLFYPDGFDFDKFFRLTAENNLTKSSDKLRLLQISFDNGFEDDAGEILGFSDIEDSAITEMLVYNENKTKLQNFRLFSELKEMLGIKPEDKDNIRFLAKYCFDKGNIIETDKLTDKLNEDIFIQNLKAILKYENKEYILTPLLADLTTANIYLSDSRCDQIMKLLEEMSILNIADLAVNNNNLALRVFLSPAFTDVFNSQISKEKFKNIDNTIQKYRRAIAVSIFMTKLLNGRESLVTPENFDKIVKISANAYFAILRQWFDKQLADKDSFVTAIFHDESADIVFKDMLGDRFNPEILKQFLNKIGIDPDNGDNVQILQRSKDPGVKFKILDRIINAPKNGVKSLFWFDGHGAKYGFSITEKEHIYFEEIADALHVAYDNGVDLKQLTLVFNSCHSGDFKDKILTMLEQRGVKDSPVIITVAGHETELGYTDIVEHDGNKMLVSNLEFSIFNLFESSSNADSANKNLLLGDFILAQNDIHYSNPTISIPITEDVRTIIERAVAQINNINQETAAGEREDEASLLIRTGTRMSLDTAQQSQKIPEIHSSSLELSIFNVLKNKSKLFAFLAKTAPVWEEIMFRVIPSAVTIFNPVAGIALFAVSQIVFLFSHTIVKWLVYRDSAGHRLDFAGILKDDFRNLSLPALAVSIPYILAIIINPVFWPMAAVSAMIVHSLFNDKLSILGYFKNVKLKDNFDIKLPLQALGIKAGDEILITYFSNDTLLITRSSLELKKFWEEYTAKNPQKAKFRNRIYANTMRVTVAKNGTVNIKELYKNKLEKYLLTQEQKNNITLFYSQVLVKSEEKTEIISDKSEEPVKDNGEEEIQNALTDKINPDNAIDFDFSRFIDGQTGNADIAAVREYIKSAIAGKDLKNSLITVTFSNSADAGLDENKIKTAARIISVLSDEFNEIFADRIAGGAGMTYFEDMLENAFVHGNNLSLSKKIFIYFGNDRDALIINSNTPQNTTIEASALATKLYLYGFGTGIKSAESVNNARYSVTGLLMPDGTEKELYIAYLSFKKYQQLKETLLDTVLKKINFSAIWNTIETKKIERRYSYTALPVLEEGESVVATNFTKDGEAEYSGDWISFTVSKKGGKYIISNVSKKENKLKWYIPPQWQISLEDKLEIAEENGKFYICSNYPDIYISDTQPEAGAETDISYPLAQRNEGQIQSELPSEQNIPADNIEFERFFELVQRNSAKKPVIGDSGNYEYKLKLQKLSFELADTLDLNQMEEFYKNDEDKLRIVKYLQILKFKRLKDNESLRAVVYNGGLNIKYRLLAFMYLRSNGVNDFSDSVLEIMKANFLIELKLNSFEIDTNFDLSVLGAGILLILSRYLTDNHYINEQQEKNLYDNISYSTFVERSNLDNSSANSGMFFTSSDPLTMAHEIGHRVLLFYTDSSKGVAYSTIHEIFAGVIAAVFAEQSEIGGKYYQDALYELFNERMKYDYVLQEEHRASSGLLYTVSEIAKRMGKTVKFEFLADAILNLLKSKKGLPQRQSDAIIDVIYEYMKVLMFKDGYTQAEIEQFEKILKEESWKSKVLELFMNLRSTSSRWDYYGERYPSFMSRIRFEVVQPESYRHGLLEIDYRDDLVVINNIIMSQPDKINIVMQIVKEELSKSDYLFRPQIAKLLFADLLVSLPQIKQLSKYQLDRLIQNLVDKFFSDKMEYAASEIDYERIRIYALEEYILIKTFFPRSFEERNSAKKDSFKNNYYRQEINQDDGYRYAESLPSFVPTMDVFFLNTIIVKIYRKFFDFTVKKLAAAKKRPRFNRDVENYLNIVRNKTQNKYLVKIINNDRASVKYRLFALMYLRNRGYDIDDKNVINDIKRKFAEAINKNGIAVNNNFDLRAVLTGVYLLLEHFSRQYVNSKQEIELYELISKAVVLRKGKEAIGARANMTFVSVNPLTMAHELGHRILAYASERSLKDITVHELFAEVTANLFAKITGLKEKEYSDVLYRLFDNSVNYDDVFQNEHRASMGFIELLRKVSAQTGRSVRWDILANAIVSYTKRSTSGIIENSQSKNLKNVFLAYLDSLYKKRQYTSEDLRNMFNAAQRINVGENAVSEILEDIKNKNPRLYGHILNALQKKMKRQKSYMKGFIPRILYSKSKVKEIADIFKEFFGIKAEYADDKDIITKLIFSQPKRINYVLKIIINQILSKRELSRYDFENLIKLEFLLNNTAVIYNSKAELESGISGILNYIIGTVGNDPFHRHYNTFNLSDYRYVQSYMKNMISGANSRLMMTRLEKLLLLLVKKDDKRQQIAVAVEYPIIILGMFFPKIRNWFIKEHKDSDTANVETKLSNLEISTAEKIKEILGFEISSISGLNFIQKLQIVSKILTNRIIKNFNKQEHLKLNEADKPAEQKAPAKTESIKWILILSISTALLITVVFHFSLLSFIFMIFPVTSFFTLLWSLLKPQSDKIYGKEKYESEYFSNIPETDYDYSQASAKDVTVQIPVFKESNDVVFNTIMQSIKACQKYSQKSGARANIVISDDGLAVLLKGKISKEDIEYLLQIESGMLTDDQKQAVERIRFYRANNISFVARPEKPRDGLFKKASNLNHTYRLIASLENAGIIEDGTYYEGNSLFIGDIILLLDKDSQLNEDVISVTVPKFIKDEKLAFTQNSTLPSNENDNYFTRFMAPFTTFLFQHIFSANAISGGLVPFVGHNGFIRKKCLEEIGNWPEDRVSEDFYTSIKFQTLGYRGMYLSFKGYEFKEIVSRSYIEEVNKILRYAFGLLELIFNRHLINKNSGVQKGVLTDWMKDFLNSGNIRWHQKINFFIYPLSYVNLMSIIPMTLISLVFKKIIITQFSLLFLIFTIPFALVMYKIYKENSMPDQKKDNVLNVFFKILLNIVSISAMFVSFSYSVLKGLRKFISKKESGFQTTNVDEENYNFKQAFDLIKKHFNKNKSAFLMLVLWGLIAFAVKPVVNAAFIGSLFYITAFSFASIIFSPFLFKALKTVFNEKTEKINLCFKIYNESARFSDKRTETGINEQTVFIVNDMTEFENKYKFINTGIKVNGKTIWQIDIDGMIVFGAEGVNIQEAAQALNGSKTLEKKIKKLLHLKKKVRLNINSVIVDEQSAEMFFYGRTAVINTDQYAKTVNKILDSISVMYAQKTIISLVNISDNDLYSALSNGALRKVITVAQFEYLKKEFERSGKDMLREIVELRKRGIEIYISGAAVDEQYKNFGISGQVIDSAVYDYYSRETFEIELIKEKISLQQLENKIINSDKPLVIEMNLLKEIFRTTKDITAAYNGLQSLIGSIKIKFGLKDIKIKDMESFAYSIDFSDLPAVRESEILFNADIDNFSDVFGLDKDNIIRIILEDVKINEDVKKVFLNVIKERILAKTKLSESNKPNGLKDKKMEILLGKLLFLRYGNADKKTLLPEIESFKGSESDMQRKINELYAQFAADNDPRIINTMIELIVIYCEEYGDKEIKRMDDINRTDSYRKMLAAA